MALHGGINVIQGVFSAAETRHGRQFVTFRWRCGGGNSVEILVDRYVLYDMMYFISNAVCSMLLIYMR